MKKNFWSNNLWAGRPWTLGEASNLGATSTAIRALKYSGRTVKDLPACVEYLISCHDNKTGGFAPTPGGEANLGCAAQGLVAIAELNMSANDLKKAGLKFLQSQVSKGQNHEPK